MCFEAHPKQCNKQAICNLLSEQDLAAATGVKFRRSVKFHREE
jgi:hypothetical protein